MIKWQPIRISILTLIFGMGLLAMGRIILFSNLEKPKVSDSIFPDKIPLAQWRLSETLSLKNPTDKHQELIPKKGYRFISNGVPLDIEMRYLENLNVADVSSFISTYTPIKSSAIMRQREGIGYYGLGVDNKRAYLSACINPRGGSTFTHAQFRDNRYHQDVRLERLLPVLQGQEPLLDKRCLWAHLSIPLNNSSPETAYKILEKAWFSWYQWWQPRFPKP